MMKNIGKSALFIMIAESHLPKIGERITIMKERMGTSRALRLADLHKELVRVLTHYSTLQNIQAQSKWFVHSINHFCWFHGTKPPILCNSRMCAILDSFLKIMKIESIIKIKMNEILLIHQVFWLKLGNKAARRQISSNLRRNSDYSSSTRK